MHLQQVYTLNLWNTGGRGEDRKVGHNIEDWGEQTPSAPYDRAKIVLRLAGRVFVAKDVLDTLCIYPEGSSVVLHGTGRRLWEVTRKDLARGLEHATYERAFQNQNPHEVMVKERNFAALAWLESLLAK